MTQDTPGGLTDREVGALEQWQETVNATLARIELGIYGNGKPGLKTELLELDKKLTERLLAFDSRLKSVEKWQSKFDDHASRVLIPLFLAFCAFVGGCFWLLASGRLSITVK